MKFFLYAMNENDWVYDVSNGDTLTVYVENFNTYVGASLNGGARVELDRKENLTVAEIYARLTV